MLRYGLIYGPIPGLVAVGTIIVGLQYSDTTGASSSQWFGYLVMLLALSVIYIAMRRYRDQVQGGVISFGRAFSLGLAISVVAGVVYVLVWELYVAISGFDFYEIYSAEYIAKKRAEGLSPEVLEQEIAKMELMKTRLENVFFRLPVTFTEIFPVGLLVSLVSAAVLRTRGPAKR